MKEDLKFYKTRRHSILLGMFYGLIFIVFSAFSFLFLSDFLKNLDSLKDFFISLYFIALFFTIPLITLYKTIENFKNTKPICILNANEFYYVEFHSKGTTSKTIKTKNIEKIVIGKFVLGDKYNLKINLKNEVNISLSYLSTFLSNNDLLILASEIENLITTDNKGFPK